MGSHITKELPRSYKSLEQNNEHIRKRILHCSFNCIQNCTCFRNTASHQLAGQICLVLSSHRNCITTSGLLLRRHPVYYVLWRECAFQGVMSLEQHSSHHNYLQWCEGAENSNHVFKSTYYSKPCLPRLIATQ